MRKECGVTESRLREQTERVSTFLNPREFGREGEFHSSNTNLILQQTSIGLEERPLGLTRPVGSLVVAYFRGVAWLSV
jgi:hypothetical protein